MTGKFVSLGLLVGSTLGSFVPYLWGDTSMFSYTNILCTAAGSFIGIWAGYKIAQML